MQYAYYSLIHSHNLLVLLSLDGNNLIMNLAIDSLNVSFFRCMSSFMALRSKLTMFQPRFISKSATATPLISVLETTQSGNSFNLWELRHSSLTASPSPIKQSAGRRSKINKILVSEVHYLPKFSDVKISDLLFRTLNFRTLFISFRTYFGPNFRTLC